MSAPWPNLSDLLRPSEEEAPVGLVGVPLGIGSVTPGRCDLAPAALRAVLRRIGRYDLDAGAELGTAIADHGDCALPFATIEAATPVIVAAVAERVRRHRLTLLVGGNNAVTRPGVLGMAKALGLPLARCGLITLDAHFDLRDTDEGLGNGNPVRALREDGLPGANIAQIGLVPFANTKAMHEDAREGGHLVVSLRGLRARGVDAVVRETLAHLAGCDAILLDCDIDVIDRAQFPGAPGARADGMASGDFFALVRAFAAEARVRVVDLTEWDPPLDPSDLSALTAGRWLAEVLAGFEARA